MRAKRVRLDQALVERQLAETRSRARALVMAGNVRVDGQRAEKAGMMVSDAAALEVVGNSRFVSRGGDKLAAALEASGLNLDGRVCLDVGASTGGFTDCLLQAGAAAVIAVDVGYGQLDWRLRQDSRVFVLERVNARYLEPEDLPGEVPSRPDLLVIDVAFISIRKVLPAAGQVCAPACDALVLVKPQFECGPERVGSGGIVSSATDRRQALFDVAGRSTEFAWQVVQAIPSPIRGASGNWECFLQLARAPDAEDAASFEEAIDAVDVPDDSRDRQEPAP